MFAFETIDFIAQALVLSLRCAQLGGDRLNEIEQLANEVARPFVGNAGEVKAVEHWFVDSQLHKCETSIQANVRPVEEHMTCVPPPLYWKDTAIAASVEVVVSAVVLATKMAAYLN